MVSELCVGVRYRESTEHLVAFGLKLISERVLVVWPHLLGVEPVGLISVG